MTVVAGIDEAGYGPLLGPLVVAAAAYRLEPGARADDLDLLARDETLRDRLLPTADSKRLYHPGGSLRRLETSVLGHMLLARGSLPASMAEMLNDAVDFDASEAEGLPWYRGRLLTQPVPRDANGDDVGVRAERHRAWLAERGARFLRFFVTPIDVPRFNRLSSAAGTKAYTLFAAAGGLIEALMTAFPHDELVVHVDRQGGRIFYADELQRHFPLVNLEVHHERPASAAYTLRFAARPAVHVDFAVQADAERAPVALASVLAKTVREHFMICMNQWFMARREGLEPTAGYGRDGRRFLLEVDRLVIESGASRDAFVRCR